MARYNFWDSFNQGLQSGQTIWKANAERNMQGDIAQAAKLDQTTGLRDNNAIVDAAQALPEGQTLSWDAENQSYVTPQGLSMSAKPVYSLNGVTRDTSFAAPEIAAARRQAVGDTYMKYGLADKADEHALRGIQMQGAQLQLNEAQDKAATRQRVQGVMDENVNVRQALAQGTASITQAMTSGKMSPEEGAQLLQQFYNHNVPNGFDMNIRDGAMWHVDPKTGKEVAMPITTQNVIESLSELPMLLDRLDKQYENQAAGIQGDYKFQRDARVQDRTLQNQDRDFDWRRGVDTRNFDYGVTRDGVKDNQWQQGFGLQQAGQQETSRHNRASEGIQASEAASNAAYKNTVADYYKNQKSGLPPGVREQVDSLDKDLAILNKQYEMAMPEQQGAIIAQMQEVSKFRNGLMAPYIPNAPWGKGHTAGEPTAGAAVQTQVQAPPAPVAVPQAAPAPVQPQGGLILPREAAGMAPRGLAPRDARALINSGGNLFYVPGQ